MPQRQAFTKWLWCLFAVYAGPGWTRAVSVRTPPKSPTTIEAQAKFFQDFFSVQLSPYKIEFGHVCEDPNTWEQRYEKKDFKNHRDMGKVIRQPFEGNEYRHLPTHEDYEQGHRQGSDRHFTERHERAKPSDGLFSAKVRWGDKNGGYGEHYWDLNHAGHAGNHGNDEYDSGSDDDGSYNHDLDHAHDDHGHDNHDTYDEPSEPVPTYGTEEYDPEKAAQYEEESGRAKRAHPRIKTERKLVRQEESYEEPSERKSNRKIKERLQAAPTTQVVRVKEVGENEQPKRKRRQRRPENDHEEKHAEKQADINQEEEQKEQKEPQYYVKYNKNEEQNQQQPQYYVKNKNEEQRQQEQQPQYYGKRTETQFVPYEQGAGVRQHQQPEQTPAASAPRLFLEPTTGHVVDRATGQAYVLQPIAINNYN